MPYPALRYVDIKPVEVEGETVFVLQDPEGFVEDPVIITPHAMFIAAQLTGTASAGEIREAFAGRFGGLAVRDEDIEQVVAYLDERGFLFTETYFELREDIETRFKEDKVRHARFAGRSYPASAEDLRPYLDEQFTREGGPGAPSSHVSNGGARISGLIVPHIDLQRGGHAYAHGYAALADCPPPHTALVFGVAHAGPPSPFILTRKDFETPLGTLPCNTEVVDTLADACAWDPYEYEIVHRTGHSIEFQALMLAHRYGSAIQIVPVLTASLRGERGILAEGVEPFLDTCARIVHEADGGILVIAAADLAHVGPCFGDDFEITDEVVKSVADRDRIDLSFAAACDAEGWYRSVLRDDNARKVCGLNCIYATLRTLEKSRLCADIRCYGYAPDPSGGIVSFASLSYGANEEEAEA